MAGYVELTIEQGADYATNVTINEDTGEAKNLVSYTASSQLRKSYYSSTAYDLNAIITSPQNGIITLSMTSANTANLTPGRMLYDVLITSPSGIKTRIIEGIAVIMPSVTR